MIREKIRKLSILVVGDIMLDTYIMGRVDRISPEAPVPIIDVNSVEHRLGGAANVAANLDSLGVKTNLLGVIGIDRDGFELLGAIKNNTNINTGFIEIDDERPTTTKTRVVAGSQQLIRYDKEIKDEYLNNGCVYDMPEVDAVIISDYGKGYITDSLMADIKAKYPSIPIIVDPNINNYHYYRARVSAITPNLKEAQAFHKSPELDETGMALLNYLSCKKVLITLGKKGMILYRDNEDKHMLPSVAKQVFDVSGAGDTVTAVFAIGMALKLKDENL